MQSRQTYINQTIAQELLSKTCSLVEIASQNGTIKFSLWGTPKLYEAIITGSNGAYDLELKEKVPDDFEPAQCDKSYNGKVKYFVPGSSAKEEWMGLSEKEITKTILEIIGLDDSKLASLQREYNNSRSMR